MMAEIAAEEESALRDFLSEARPDWKAKALNTVEEKLGKASIFNVHSLVVALRGRGEKRLNAKLQAEGQKCFAQETLGAFRRAYSALVDRSDLSLQDGRVNISGESLDAHVSIAQTRSQEEMRSALYDRGIEVSAKCQAREMREMLIEMQRYQQMSVKALRSVHRARLSIEGDDTDLVKMIQQLICAAFPNAREVGTPEYATSVVSTCTPLFDCGLSILSVCSDDGISEVADTFEIRSSSSSESIPSANAFAPVPAPTTPDGVSFEMKPSNDSAEEAAALSNENTVEEIATLSNWSTICCQGVGASLVHAGDEGEALRSCTNPANPQEGEFVSLSSLFSAPRDDLLAYCRARDIRTQESATKGMLMVLIKMEKRREQVRIGENLRARNFPLLWHLAEPENPGR